MNKNAIIAVLGIAVAATLSKADSKLPPVGTKVVDPKSGIEYVVVEVPSILDGGTNTTTELAPLTRFAKHRPLEPEATKRLHDGPVIVSSLFEASGRAEHASYGKAISGSFLYTTVVTGRSEVVTCETTDAGRVHVVERRKFLASRDSLSLSKVDAAIALDTLPVEQVRDWGIYACETVATLAGYLGRPDIGGGALLAGATIEGCYEVLKEIDGISIRGVLGFFGVDVPDNVDIWASKQLQKIAKRELDAVHVYIQSIEGKSFLITYEQEASGKPLDVSYRNEDGSPISEAEWEILRQANLFLDQDMVPNARCRVGDSWKVWADEVQELFGVAGSGRAEGQILVTRTGDRPNGDWTLKLSGTDITFRSDEGTVSGTMKIKDGNSLVDANKASVKTLHASATGDLRVLNKKRHLLFFDFVKRLRGEANLRFTLATEPAPKTAK